jgi:hypothetical protein
MAIRRFSTAEPGVKSNKFWDQDTAQGAVDIIRSETLTGNTISDVKFTNIPQTYQDLFFVVHGRSDFSGTEVLIQSYVNDDFSSLYSATKFEGDGSSNLSTRATSLAGFHLGYVLAGTSTANGFGTVVGNIADYTSSSKNKLALSRSATDRNGSGRTTLMAALYRSTSPVTILGIATYGVGNWVPGSIITLYGIKAGA